MINDIYIIIWFTFSPSVRFTCKNSNLIARLIKNLWWWNHDLINSYLWWSNNIYIITWYTFSPSVRFTCKNSNLITLIKNLWWSDHDLIYSYLWWSNDTYIIITWYTFFPSVRLTCTKFFDNKVNKESMMMKPRFN